ncbi:MAG: alpha/beta fold hydrolase [Chitinophagales bacterium]|nr:alpha/beta fold hydrolase [Chitinophagales bacterium]
MRRSILIILIICLFTSIRAQEEIKLRSGNIEMYGTIITPAKQTNRAILIIVGSGSTDRDGNTKPVYVNNCLKMLAEELSVLGYCTLRYDKRGVGKSNSDSLKSENLRFEQYVTDAIEWINFLKKKYADITVIGHSQGALVGMMAVQKTKVNRFISLAGLSEDAYTTVKRQLSNQPKVVRDAAYPILDSLKNEIKVNEVPAYLNSLFNPKTQDYFISFMRYNPRVEITKINCPILVIQGTSDLQITVEGATEMSNNSQNSTLKIIEGMNHVLKKSSNDVSENMSTYNNAALPLHPDLIMAINQFLEK